MITCTEVDAQGMIGSYLFLATLTTEPVAAAEPKVEEAPPAVEWCKKETVAYDDAVEWWKKETVAYDDAVEWWKKEKKEAAPTTEKETAAPTKPRWRGLLLIIAAVTTAVATAAVIRRK